MAHRIITIVLASLMGSKSSTSFAAAKATSPKMPHINLAEKKAAALFGLFVADATAMPVHWMYNLRNLKRDYGRITGYVKPKDKLEGSILNLSNTGGGGRGSDQGDIVGTVILHGKKKYWLRGGNFHYHLGLEAGENTLEAQLCRLLIRSIAANEAGEFSSNDFLQHYMTFMQTPGSHNDTYASTCHRMFFANLVRGVPPEQCADNDGHNTDAIDALTLTVPVIIKYANADRTLRNRKLAEIIATTRKSRVLQPYAELYADILIAVLQGQDIRVTIDEHAPSYAQVVKHAIDRHDSDPMVACYIDSAFPALLFFAYKYGHSVEEAILASANAGGENVARGALLGALVGAQHGFAGFPAWTSALKDKDAIMQEIDQLTGSA